MLIVNNLEQNTQQWLAWRRKGIGSSDAATLFFGTYWEDTIYSLWHDKVGKGKPKTENPSMTRGKILEPKARELYQAVTGITSQPVCAIHHIHEFIKASLDGWDSEKKIIGEIKCINKYDHQTALEGKVPEKYQPQILHQYLVSDGEATMIHYISYNPGKTFRKSEHLAIVPVPTSSFDPDLVDHFKKKEIKFWDHVTRNFPPGKDFVPIKEELGIDTILS